METRKKPQGLKDHSVWFILGYENRRKMSFSVLTCYDNPITAHLLRIKLESAGIPCFLNNEHFSGLMPHYFNMLGSGVQVLVPGDQLEIARRIAKLDDGKLLCPNCLSARIENESETGSWKFIIMAIALFLLVPIGNLLNSYICKDCGHEFRK